MNLTWSHGFEQRQQKKRGKPNGTAASQTLPSIRPEASAPSNSPPPRLCADRGLDPFGYGSLLGSSASEPTLRSIAAAKVAGVIERQTSPTAMQERREAFSKARREVTLGGKASEDAAFWGAHGVAGFRLYLEKRFGSLVAGWRALDKDKSGRLSFYEFCNACRGMGYHGNMKKLWEQLDKNCNGMVSLMEIDPEVGRVVGTFKIALLNKYGDMLTAWRKGIDLNGNLRVDEREIVDCVGRLGLDVDGKRLFKMLSSHGSSVLTLQDFDPDAHARFLSGDYQGLNFRGNKEFLEDLPGENGGEAEMPPSLVEHQAQTDGARKWRAHLVGKDKAEVRAAQEEDSRLRLGLHTVPGFKKALIGRCGSLWGAWREALDLDGNGRITFGEFCQALARLAFHGDVQGLWKQLLKDGRTQLLFSDLDPETDTLLTELRAKLCEAHGNMLLAWVKAMDTNGTGKVSKEEFLAACSKVGFSGNAETMFKNMQPDVGRTFLTLKDFDTKAYNALNRGDLRMLSEKDSDQAAGKRPHEMSFHERQQSGFHFQLKKALQIAQSEEFAKVCKMRNVPAHLIDTAEEFELLCKRTYGTIIAAWRQCLDVDGNGKLTFNEFCKALRRIGYGGDFKVLWAKYGGPAKGHVALKDIDRDADECVDSFLKLLAEKYGTLDHAWKLGFGKDPNESIDEKGLQEACEKLGYPHSGKKLFRCLQPAPGKLLITIWDLDPLCTRKKQRGEEAFISQPKSPISHPEIPRKAFGQAGADADEGAASRSLESPSKQRATATLKAGADQLPQLRQVLRQRFGSTATAWRCAMDPRFSGGISFGNFVLFLEGCDYAGNVKALWKVLCGERSTASFRDIDPDAQQMLDRFREQLIDKYGCLAEAWTGGLDAASAGKVAEEAFTTACDQLGFSVRNPRKLFQALLCRHGQRSLTKEDLRALLIGLPSAADRERAWGGASAAPAPETAEPEETNAEEGQRAPPARPSALAITVSEASPRGSPPSSVPPSPKPQASPRDLAKSVTEDWLNKDKVISTVDGWKRILITKYGSLFAAWRALLDGDHNGIMAQIDFANSCRMLGVKAIQRLWSELDPTSCGHVSLRDLDPATADAIKELEDKLTENFPTKKAGWRKTFDPDRCLRTDLAKFTAGWQKLGCAVMPPEKAFRLLRPEPGRQHLTYEDLWPDLDRNCNVEDKVAGAQSPRSPPRSPSRSRPDNPKLEEADDF